MSTITWKIDPSHSSAGFKVKHMMISNVKGAFTGITGTLVENTEDPTKSTIDAVIDVNTLSTGDADRDTHLKNPDFFDAESHTHMKFKSTKVVKDGDSEYKVTGDLTVHGVTKPVVFEVEGLGAPGKDPYGNTRTGLEATTKINRKDFGLVYNAALETGGILIGEDVTITLDIQFLKA